MRKWPDAATLKVDAANATVLEQKEEREKSRCWVDAATPKAYSANAAMLEEGKKKRKDWSLRSVKYAVLLSHVRSFCSCLAITPR
jgi:hypothetical protein